MLGLFTTRFFIREKRLPEPLDATDAELEPREEGAAEEAFENMDDRRRLPGRFFSTVDMAADEAEGDGYNIVRAGFRRVFQAICRLSCGWNKQTRRHRGGVGHRRDLWKGSKSTEG
jgi:hypothetical protein